MSKKYFIALGLLLVIAAAGIVVWLIMKDADRAHPTVEIIQNGTLLRTVPLSEDTEFTIKCAEGFNTVTIKDGAVMISSADCPDLICVKTGSISGGAMPIICLPHRLEIRVVNSEGTDAMI